MISRSFRSDLILLLAAVIWGFAFVAQRVGMNYVGPFTYNGVRFALGAVVLLPFLWFRIRSGQPLFINPGNVSRRKTIFAACLTGVILFVAVALQQVGLLYTTAGKAGFITGLYVVLVPVAGMFIGHKSHAGIWIGAALSLAGLYFLSITRSFTIEQGDFLVLLCAIVFTFHVLIIAWLSPKTDSYFLAVIQFSICAILNIIIAFAIEPVTIQTIMQAWIPIGYGGILSVGVAYTLQIVAQKTAHPAYASIILSLESVFAVLGGWLLLNEVFTPRMLLGCLLIMAGMVMAQVRSFKVF